MRLIDADALKERAIRVSTLKEHCYMKAVGTHEIDKAPTIDAVEVVRCKECEFCAYNSSNDTFKCRSMRGMYRAVDPTEFCSWGERKNDGWID